MAKPQISFTVETSEIVGCGWLEVTGNDFTPHGKVSLRWTGSVVVGHYVLDAAIANKKGSFSLPKPYGTPGPGCVPPSSAPEGTLKVEAKDNKTGASTFFETSVQNCWMQVNQECW